MTRIALMGALLSFLLLAGGIRETQRPGRRLRVVRLLDYLTVIQSALAVLFLFTRDIFDATMLMVLALACLAMGLLVVARLTVRTRPDENPELNG